MTSKSASIVMRKIVLIASLFVSVTAISCVLILSLGKTKIGNPNSLRGFVGRLTPLTKKSTCDEVLASKAFLAGNLSAQVDHYRRDMFEQQHNLLNTRMAEQSLAAKIAMLTPVRTWVISDDYMGEGYLSDYLLMTPLVMTSFAMPVLDSDVAKDLQVSGSLIKVLKIEGDTCLTVVANTNFAFVVEFSAERLTWVPVSARLYELACPSIYEQRQKEKAVERLRNIMGDNFEVKW